MKRIGMVQAGMLSLTLIVTAGFGYAQHEDKGDGRDKRQDSHGQPSDNQQHGQPQQHAQQQRQQNGEQPQHAQQQQRIQPNQQQENWQRNRAHNFESQHQTWTQRGGYRGDRVPETNFRQSFGRQHSFRVYGLPYMEMGGRSRFQYGGYWFNVMDPYPEYWGANWYRNDDMYVDYNDGGYYLYNRRFPSRPGVAISISF